MRLTQILMLGVVVLLSSCWGVPRVYRRQLDCYTGANPGLDTLINMQGFYRKMEIRDQSGIYKHNANTGKLEEIGIDTSYYDFMFFPDGMYMGNFHCSNDSAEQVVAYMHHQILQDLPITGFWNGTYTVHGDTIKVKKVGDGGAGVWLDKETWYRIIDRNTVVDFYAAHLYVSRANQQWADYDPKFYDDAKRSTFVPLSYKPKSTSWLKDKEWFTCKK